MSLHKSPIYNNEIMHSYMLAQGLDIHNPSQLSDAFRLGWVAAMDYSACVLLSQEFEKELNND
jgi:hypothetical protein